MGQQHKKKHKKKPRSADKIGRNKVKCERYRREGRRERNRERRAARLAKAARRTTGAGVPSGPGFFC